MSSTSTYTSSTSSIYSLNGTNQLIGLSSGLDTESIVKSLTYLEQSKIDKAKQQLQLLEWQRDDYRAIITKLNDFYSKYFSSTSDSYMSSSTLGKLSATSNGSQYVSVVPGANASAGNIVISDIVSLATASRLESSSTVSAPVSITVDPSTVSNLSGKSMKITLDGVEKIIIFPTATYSQASDVQSQLQSLLNSAFGENRVNVAISGNELTLDAGASILTISNSGITGQEAGDVLIFRDGQSNRLNLTDKLSSVSLANPVTTPISFTINGKSFSFTGDNTIKDIIDSVNSSDAGVTMSYSTLNDKFTFTSKQTGTGNTISFQDTQGNFLTSIIGTGVFTEGTNAVIKINTNASSADPSTLTYTTVTRSTNTFEIDGTTYTLLGKASGTTEENISISVSYNVDDAVEKIKSFINDYNDLLDTLNDKLSETRYKDYPPLTEEQRNELSESEIEKWEEKAKSGLLRNDSTLQSIVTSLRTAMYSTVYKLTDNSQSIGMILTDTGIKTGVYSEKGKLHVDETRLREVLEKDPDTVISLFTQKSSVRYSPYLTDTQKEQFYNESGLFNRIANIISTSTSTTLVKGTLIELVGKDDTSTNDIYSRKIAKMQDTISELNYRLTQKENYYWAKFNSMESALSTLNSQSTWLSSMFSYQ